MKSTARHIASVVLSSVLLAAPAAAEQSSRAPKKRASAQLASAAVKTPETVPQAKVVAYNPQDVVPVRTKVRFVTLIVLPQGEEILEVACGDKDFWSINGVQNLAYVKPAQEGIKTNLNLVTASGNIYSFILSEGSSTRGEPDFKVVIEPGGASAGQGPRAASSDGAPKFVSVREFEDTRREMREAQEDARKARAATHEAVAAGVRQFVSNLRFAYRFEAGRKPFHVRAMGHDNRFTYIHARPEETPTLYEIKDGKPNLVSFDYQDGVYVISKILDSGYLAIGKRRLPFKREE
jgi:Conjugal transfer protein